MKKDLVAIAERVLNDASQDREGDHQDRFRASERESKDEPVQGVRSSKVGSPSVGDIPVPPKGQESAAVSQERASISSLALDDALPGQATSTGGNAAAGPASGIPKDATARKSRGGRHDGSQKDSLSLGSQSVDAASTTAHGKQQAKTARYGVLKKRRLLLWSCVSVSTYSLVGIIHFSESAKIMQLHAKMAFVHCQCRSSVHLSVEYDLQIRDDLLYLFKTFDGVRNEVLAHLPLYSLYGHGLESFPSRPPSCKQHLLRSF